MGQVIVWLKLPILISPGVVGEVDDRVTPYLADRAEPLLIVLWRSRQPRALHVEHSGTLVTAQDVPPIVAHPTVRVILGGLLWMNQQSILHTCSLNRVFETSFVVYHSQTQHPLGKGTVYRNTCFSKVMFSTRSSPFLIFSLSIGTFGLIPLWGGGGGGRKGAV